MKAVNDKMPDRIEGFVTPLEWDRHSLVVRVAIVTDSFEKYVVAHTGKGRELCDLLDQKVEVLGVISGEDVMGNPVIIAQDYHIISRDSNRHLAQRLL